MCMYESIYWICFLTLLGPVVADDFCLKVKKKRQKTLRTRGFIRFISTVHRIKTLEKQRFRSCPEKKRENRTKPRFFTDNSYCAPWRKNGVVRFSLRRVEPHRTKKRSTWNRAELHRTIYHSTEPHSSFYDIWKPQRTVGFLISESRTEPHRRIYHSTEPHRRISFFSKPHGTAP